MSVLAGYTWLSIAGVHLAFTAPLIPGPRYDAILHAIFLGFVFSMVFGHAPIILPAVLRVDVPYARASYVPLALLHLSVAVRVAGDLSGFAQLRVWGRALNVAALGAFGASMVILQLRAQIARRLGVHA